MKTAAAPATEPAAEPPEHESRRLILDTAARLFREQGYAATTLRTIAAACGMKAGSLYYHFAGKDEIVAEVLRTGVQRTYDDVRAAVQALPPGADAQALLGTAVRAHLQAMLRRHDYTSANVRIFGQVPPAIREAHLALRDEYEQFWAALLARCARAEPFDPARDLRLARFFLIGAMNASLDWFTPRGKARLDALADELTALVLGGLRARTPRPAASATPAPKPRARTR